MKNIDETTKFYKKLFKEDESCEQFELRSNFIYDKTYGTLYKFIAFKNGDKIVNKNKLKCLINNKIWVSCICNFIDNNEFFMSIDYKEASSKTNASIKELKEYVSLIREFEDVVCFTNNITEEKWDKYANNHNGICLEFQIENYEAYFPVLYVDKDKFDYTKLLIEEYIILKENPFCWIKSNYLKFSEYAPIIKDKAENEFDEEIRFRSSQNTFLGSRRLVTFNMKKKTNIHGFPITYDECGIVLKKIFLGKNLNIDIKRVLLNYSNIKKYIDIKDTSN
ncbi:MAG: hypothetical protein RSC27_03920 [Bacilli bacterium]